MFEFTSLPTNSMRGTQLSLSTKPTLLANQKLLLLYTRRATLTVYYGDSLAVECASVVHSFLQCIVGLNECTREHPLWFRTLFKMAVPSNSALFEGIGGDFVYSLGLELDALKKLRGAMVKDITLAHIYIEKLFKKAAELCKQRIVIT